MYNCYREEKGQRKTSTHGIQVLPLSLKKKKKILKTNLAWWKTQKKKNGEGYNEEILFYFWSKYVLYRQYIALYESHII